MLFYYGRQYKSALVGKRLIPVHCDRCGCEYYYELRASDRGTQRPTTASVVSEPSVPPRSGPGST